MKAVRFFLLILIIAFLPLTILAQLPVAPSKETVLILISQLLTEGRTSVPIEMRETVAREVQQKLNRAPEYQLYSQVGVLFFARSCLSEALWAFSEAAARNSDNPDVFNNLAEVLIALDRKEEAEKLLLYVAHRWPDYAPALVNLCILYMRLGKTNLAELCLKLAREAEPGFAPTERVSAQLARTKKDKIMEAQSALNWSYLDPGDKESLKALHNAPRDEVLIEINRRFKATPVPQSLIILPDIEEDVKTFVYLEEYDHFWAQVLNHSTQKVAEIVLKGGHLKEVPSEVWDKLSEEQKKAMINAGFRPTQKKRMLAPLVEELLKARENYPFLADVIQSYEDAFFLLVKEAFEKRQFQQIIQKEHQRQLDCMEKYFKQMRMPGLSDMPQSVIPILTEYLREAFSTLIPTHKQLRELFATARKETVNALRKLYRTEAILIDMVPTQYQKLERQRLEEVAFSANFYYALNVASWWQVARIPVLMGQHIEVTIRESLKARNFEAWLSMEEHAETAEDIEEPGIFLPLLLPKGTWMGMDLGILAMKAYANGQIEISGGEIIVAEAKYDIKSGQFFGCLGFGVKGTTLDFFGGEIKALVVVRVDPQSSSPPAVGLNGKITAKFGTPFAGLDVDVVNETLWLIGGN